MDFDAVIARLNDLIRVKQPESFNSSWILQHAPECYRYIQRNIRLEVGGVDWDRITCALEWKFQRRWPPGHWRKKKALYENQDEVDVVLNNYRDKLFVFIAAQNQEDRRMRDIIAISLVRLSQNGNILAKQELLELLLFSVEEWIAKYIWLSRWSGYDEKIKEQLEGCIHRYRYTGSFLRYVYKTLEYAGRGIRPLYAFSLNEPVFEEGASRIDRFGYDPANGEICSYARGIARSIAT